MSTSMTSNEFANNGQRQPRKFAFREGHFIPGIRYVGTKDFNDVDDLKAKSVVLKQLQPKITKFTKQQLSPRPSKE